MNLEVYKKVGMSSYAEEIMTKIAGRFSSRGISAAAKAAKRIALYIELIALSSDTAGFHRSITVDGKKIETALDELVMDGTIEVVEDPTGYYVYAYVDGEMFHPW